MRTRILIVNVNWVGDIIFSTPFIRALRQAYPHSYIACLVHPRCREMLEGNPRLDEVITYDEEGVHRSIIGKLRLALQLRARHFDAAFLLHRSFTKALLTVLAGIPERIGYPTKRRAGMLTQVIDEPAGPLHQVEYFLNLARAAQVPVRDISYEFFVREEDRTAVRALLAGAGIRGDEKFVVICPGGNWDPKRWGRGNFATLADMMIERYGVRIVIAAAAKDKPLADDIARRMHHPAAVLAGRTTLKELGALLERATLVVANDSGPMHMAVAMRTPVIALFGPTDPRLTGPYGAGEYQVISKHTLCEVPCYDVTCQANECMAAITVRDVMDEVDRFMTSRKAGHGHR